MGSEAAGEEKAVLKKVKPEGSRAVKKQAAGTAAAPPGLAGLQRRIGNRALQRLLAQRGGNAPAELDEDTAARIDRERGGGQALDAAVQEQAGEALGHDFGGVRVHTSPEADSLNRQLSAKAFTTGQDVFFRAGAYEPQSSSGRELITHELAHVVQQGAGAVGGSGRMEVNPPGDIYEQEADQVAKAVSGSEMAPTVQRQQPQEEEEENKLQTQAGEEEEELQMQAAEEEEELQAQAAEAEEGEETAG